MNYGLKKEEPSAKDYVFTHGKELTADWTPFLPKKELQAEKFESFACISFTVLNYIEILIRRQYGEEVNFSDRFLASISGTDVGGNTSRKVCDALRHNGVCEEALYPFTDDFDSFYSEIPEQIKFLAKEFKKNWKFTYRNVPKDRIKDALKTSPLLVSVPAWHEKDDIYYRPKGVKDNHATTLIKDNLVFDSYENNLKRLDPDI